MNNRLRFIKHLFVGLFFFTKIGLSAQSTFTVTNTNDSGAGSLRQVIIDANANGAGLDIINFSEEVAGTILLNSQLPVITTALTINGPGEEVLNVSGQNAHRILFINSSGDVTINDLTLKEGRAQGGNAGSGASGGGGGAGMGGAIFLENGNLSLHFTSLVSNTARGGKGGTFNNPSTALGGAGGAGPLGAGGNATYEDGVDGIFGSGGSGGGLRFSGQERANGGNGGYGAGAGSVGSSGGGASGVGTTGVPGTFGGSTSNPVNGVVQSGGGGAGLGAALFIYGGSVSLNTVTVLNNSTQSGAAGGSGASSGQAKASGIFHYSGSITNNGVFVSGNSAPNAGSSTSDNADFYSQTGLSLSESNPPVISKSIPVEGENNYQKADGLVIYMNENIFKTDGSAIADADLSGIIIFKETNASGADIAFTASIVRNKITITPDNELVNGQTYYIAVANIEDRYGNEMATAETITFTVDGTAPVFTADPESGTTILGRSFTFTADEPFFDLDGTAIEPSEYINVVKVRLDDVTGDLVSTTITKDGNTLQVSLDESLSDQLYHVTLENIADANGNEIAPQVFTFSRPAFADAKIRVNPSNGSELATRAIEVTFDEEYYVEVSTGSFALFNTRTYTQAYTDAVLDLKLNDENGTDIIDRWSFDDGKLYILNDLAPSSTYYFQIANLFTADQTPVEPLKMTFTTPDTFNPVQGSGYGASFSSVYTDQNESLGTAYSVEFAVKMNSSGYNQVFFWGWSPTNADKMIFWLNGDKLTLSKVDGSANIIDNQSIESSAITGFDSYQDVAFTYDNGNIVLYHNGVAVGSGSMDLDNYKLTGFAYPSSNTITGSFGTVYLSGRGLLYTDEIRIWDTALTAQTILDGINTPITTAHPQFADLKHVWTFDENGGKLGFDAKTGIANLCFSCSGATPNWEKSNRRDEPLIQVSHGGETLVVGDEISFIAGNGGQLQKEFTITNTGTADLELLGEASVSDFEGRFEIDYSETDLLLAPGASTSFTVTFQSNDVRSYNTIITIPNNSLDNVFELSLTAKGISTTSGNWQTFGSPRELPQIFNMWAHDGKLTVTAELTQEPYTRFIVDVTENAGRGLSYSTPTYLSSSVIYGNYFFDLMGDGSGNYYVNNQNNIGQIKNLVTNEIQTYGMNTTHDDFTDGELKTDRNGVIHYLHSYYDGAATSSFGLKIEKGHPSTETIILTFGDLVNFGGNINATHITAYSMGFDSNNDLYVVLTTNESNPEPRLYLLKYDASTGWDDLGYDSFTDPHRSTLSAASYLKLVIDENDFLHLGTVSDQALIYQKFASDGTLIEGGMNSDSGLGLNIPFMGSFSRNNFFGLGAAGEPMFIVKSGSSSISSVVYEDGALSLFNQQYITGSDPGSFSSFFCSIDQQTGQPYVVKNGIGNNVAYTMQGISPELSVTFDGDPLERGANWPIQTGVGTSYEFDMIVSNSGFTNLHLTGDPLLAITGDQSADLSYNADELPSILKIGESVIIPITFAPTTIYADSELMVQLSTNSPYGDFEFTISLSSLDDTNTGEWTLHTDIVDPPYTDVDMRIGKGGQPVYTYNTYQTIVYPSGPNAGVTIPYARLETYQESSGTNTFDPDILDENINLGTAYPLTDYFPQIQSLVNPTNNLNYFAFGRISNGIVPTLYNVNQVAGLSVADYAYSLAGRADFEFDEEGTSWFLGIGDVSPGYIHIAAAQAGEQNVTFSGTSRNSKDLDLEITPDFMYSMTQENGQSLGYKSPRGTHSTDQGAVTFLGSSSNQLRNGNYSDETHNKDIELFDGTAYTAWITSTGGIQFYENTFFVSAPSATNVIDLQLQIHPDGTPYIAYIEDLGANQFPVSVIKLVDGVWETVGEPRFSYGDYNDQHSGLTNAPTRPALRAAFQINDLGQLFVFYGDIYSVTEAPETFNHPPAFTSTPVTEANEGEEYSYEIVASDSDLDALTFGTADLPEWLTLTDNGDGTASISGTPTDEDAIEYAFSVTVSDGSLTTSQEVSLIVNDLNTAPTFDQPVAAIAIDQDTESYTLDLTGISDGDVYLEQDLSLSATLDNNYLIRTIFASVNEDGTGSLFIQPFAGESGVVTIMLTLMDDGDPALSESYNVELTINPIIDPNAIQVTNLNDSGDGSLRAAMEQANINPDHDVIDMRLIEGQIDLQSSLPVLTTNMDIVGVSHAQVTVDGGSTHQVFYVTSGNVLLKGFQVANGFNSGGNGTQGSGGGGGGAGFGGAVFLDGGNLIVNRMNFTGNVALGGNGGNAGAVNGGNGGSSIFGDGGAGGAAGNYDTHGAAGASGSFYGTGGGGGEKGFSGFSGGKGGDGNFGGGAGGGAGVSSGSSYGNPGSPGTFGGNAGKANNGGAGGGGAGLGGAIYAKSGSLIVNETTFTSNAATGGSKGTNSGSTSVLQPTNGFGKGGAIFVNTDVPFSNLNNTFNGNAASAHSGIEGIDDVNIYTGSTTTAPSTLLSTSYIDENQSGSGLVVAMISTFTGNPGDIISYSLDAGFGDNSSFVIVDDELQLADGVDLDFEVKSTYSIQISTTVNSVAETQIFTITVNDLNDPATDFDLSDISLDEGQPVGTVVGTFSATDADLTNTHIYSLVSGFEDNASFQIVGDELQVAEVFDFDVKSSYSIQVELDDSGVILTRDFTITVNNINVAPTAITISNSSIPENSYGDVLIGSLSAVDGDDEDTHTFGFTGVAGLETDDFKLINGDLYTNRNFDFETEASLQVEIYARDNNAESVDQIFTITITDANDVPTGLTISSSEIEEAQPVGTEIGTLSALDPDAGDTHTYTLVSGFEQNYAVDIVGNSLQTAIELDFDVLPVLNLKINVNDGNGGVNEFELTITTTNANQAPTDIALSRNDIDEDAVPGSVIGILSTTDPDANDTHTYEVLTSIEYEGTTIFPIVANGANLVTTVPLDFETLPIFNIDVQVTDAEGLTFTESFTLYTNDVNEAPTSMTLNANTTAENTAAGVRIGQLIAVDPDANDPLTYSLVSGEGDEGNAFFQIGGAGNELENAAMLDFEAQSTYSVRARVTDAAGLFYEEAFTIQVVDGNDQPTAIAISSNEIEEDAPIGTVIGSLTTTDEDANDEHTYEVLAINDQTTQEFIMDGANLITTILLDFETTPVYSVVIEATDEGGLTWPETFEIVVIDANDAPTAITLSNDNIDEDAAVGSVVGALSTTDPDSEDTHTYEVTSSIEIDGETVFPFVTDGGNLITNMELNFESMSGFFVNVQTTDAEGLTYLETLSIGVNDVNEAPTSMTLNATTIAENTAAGVRIGQLIAVDPDANDPLTYSLVPGEGDEGNAFFQIGGAGNELENAAMLDFEAQSTYSVRARVTDAAGLFYEEAFTIHVVDGNDQPTAIAISSNEIEEDAPIGTVIGSLTTTDEDANDQHTYEVLAINDQTTSQFIMDGANLITTVPLDFETTPVYSVVIEATDEGGLTWPETFEIVVIDANDAPTAITLSNDNIDEDAAVGSVVGALSTTDPDSEDTHTYEVTSSIEIDGETVFPFVTDGANLITNMELNFESMSGFFVNVQTTDAEGLTYLETLTIGVNDVNEAPTAIYLSSNTIQENFAAGVRIGILTYDDQDTRNDPITFSLVSGAGDEGNAFFQIGGASGTELENAEILDFEAQSSYSIRLQVDDNAGGTYEEVFTIEVTDSNDPPTGIELSTGEVFENAPIGATIGSFSAIDQDVDDTHTYTFHVNYPDKQFFTIDGANLKVGANIDFEATPTLTIGVVVNDANGGNSFTKEFEISIANINEAPTDILLSNSSFDENSEMGVIIGAFSTIDPDAGNTYLYTVKTSTILDGVEYFDVYAEDGLLKVGSVIDFETTPVLIVDIESRDQGGLSFIKTFEITINDVNENPVVPQLSNATIDENIPVGSLVGIISSEDPDAGDVVSYSINPDYENGDMFEVIGNELRTAVSIDFEFQNNPVIEVIATDAGGLMTTNIFDIIVNDLNEAPTTISLSRSDIDEDAQLGSVIGTLSTTDPDEGDTHTYEVLTSIVIDGNTYFPIVADGANLVTNSILDFEEFPIFVIDVKSTDEGGLSYTETFTLTANDVNETPTAVTISANTIDENVSIGTLIGNLSTIDEDVNDTHSYSLIDGFEDNQDFSISGSNLMSNAVFDFETEFNYTIKVRTMDAGGNVFEQELNILVNDANDAPTAIALSSNSLEENKATGTVIGSFSATDEDADAAHSFTLVSGFGDNSDFSISNNELISAAEFDFETKDSYSIKVKADDGAGGSFEQEFTIDILNVTEGVSQTITFDPLPSKTFGDEPFELAATASSGLEVVYTSSNSALVSISGSTATILAAGEVTITASQSGEEGTFEAATPVSQVLTVNRASQTITFDAIADQVAGTDPITLVASSTSGLEVSFSVTGAASLNGNTLTITGVGEVIVTASQTGSVNYEAATDVVRSFVVNDPVKTDQTITFNPPATVYVNDESIVLQATSDSGLEVAFEVVSGSEFISQSGNALIIVKAGTVSVRAYQGGDETFNPASVVKQIVIKPVFTVSGTVTDENGEAFTEGVVGIINAGETSGTGAALDAAGNYTFTGVKEGIYYVGVIPNDETTYYTTAYGDAIIYQNATPINLTSDISNIDIQMVAKASSTNELTGDGEVTGRVIEDDGAGSRIEMGSILEGVAVEGASIFLVRKSDDKILTEVFSDVNGDFKISGIPEGSFSILINIPGVAGNVSSDITVKKGTKVQMTAMVGEDGIVFETEVSEVLGLDDLKWTMYPNPAQDFIKLEVDGVVTFRILSINGRSIEGDSFENETRIDIKELKPGIYFLELIKDGKASVQKFIKVN